MSEGTFVNRFEKPEPFEPGRPTVVRFRLPDVNHTFREGHKIMVQVQSSLARSWSGTRSRS
jgi:uncharacterized protein